MRHAATIVAFALTPLPLGGCASLTHARPTPRHSVSLEASAGGPVTTALGAPIPLPLSTVGASYGVTDRFDVQAHVHLTTAIALGIGGLDVGATWMPLEQRHARPALAFTARVYGFSNFRTGVLPYLEASATTSWLIEHRMLLWGTVGLLSDLIDGYVHWSPGLGGTVLFGRFGLGLELRWYDPGYVSRFSPANWVSAGGLGAFGLILGAQIQLGGRPLREL